MSAFAQIFPAPCAFCGGRRIPRDWSPGYDCERCGIATWDSGLFSCLNERKVEPVRPSLEGIYRYCPFSKVEEAARLGWHVLGLCPGHHGHYSFLVVWLCDCPPRWFEEAAA